MVEETGDFDILVNTFQAAEQGHITRRRDPDIALTCPFQVEHIKGEISNSFTCIKRRSRSMESSKWLCGAIAYGEFLIQSLKNESFGKTIKAKTADSYKDWWYEQSDPLYYLDKETSSK